MAENTSGPHGCQRDEATGARLRLVRGDASPEELAALVAVLAAGRGEAEDADPGDPHSLAAGPATQSRWSSPRRMVRLTPPHGHGAWRASARSR